MLAFLFLLLVLALTFAIAELSFRVLRRARTLSRWRALALCAVSIAGVAGVLYGAHFFL